MKEIIYDYPPCTCLITRKKGRAAMRGNTIEKAIETYGKDMQLTVAVEEFSELIKEICKSKRGRDNRDNIIEEMADCEIMLDQMRIIFDIREEEISDKIIEKLERLEKILAEAEKVELIQ